MAHHFQMLHRPMNRKLPHFILTKIKFIRHMMCIAHLHSRSVHDRHITNFVTGTPINHNRVAKLQILFEETNSFTIAAASNY